MACIGQFRLSDQLTRLNTNTQQPTFLEKLLRYFVFWNKQYFPSIKYQGIASWGKNIRRSTKYQDEAGISTKEQISRCSKLRGWDIRKRGIWGKLLSSVSLSPPLLLDLPIFLDSSNIFDLPLFLDDSIIWCQIYLTCQNVSVLSNIFDTAVTTFSFFLFFVSKLSCSCVDTNSILFESIKS